MIVKELSQIGKQCLENRSAGIIGLSIRNAYFRDPKNLEMLMSYGVENFSKIYIMLPDVPAISTLMSFGYAEKEAKQKSNLACNNLQNKCVRILSNLTTKENYEIIRWAKIQDNAHYLESLNQLTELYSANEHFRHAIRSTTMQVIFNNGTELPLEEALNHGVRFILQELAFITNAPRILSESATAYIYHLEMKVLKELIENKYSLKMDPQAGYIVAETESSALQKSAI